MDDLQALEQWKGAHDMAVETMTRVLTDEPTHVARLPHWQRLPVPWFVAWVDGKPDFRIMSERKLERAVRGRLCWMCGKKLGPVATFVIGPMCAVNRTSAEPPCHPDCAAYAAVHCPFLTRPQMVRRDTNKPAGATEPAGEMIKRNPGVVLLWTVRRWSRFPDGRGGLLFNIGEPLRVSWYAEGRPATRQEVEASIDSGLPILESMIDEDDREEEERELTERVFAAKELLPA